MAYDINHLHLLTLNTGFARHQANWNWKNVRSPFARLYLVTDGEAEVVTQEGSLRLTPGHLYLIPAYMRHSYVCNGTFCHYYLHILEENSSEENLLEQSVLPIEVKAQPIDELLMQRLCDINPALKLPASNPNSYDNHQTLVNNLKQSQQQLLCDKIESRGIVYQLLSRFIQELRPKSSVSDNRIQRALCYIRRHLYEQVSIAELADIACMSKDHFIRIFKREMQSTPTAYIIKCKIEKAELSLVTTNRPVKSIAASLGYDDYSYFNRLFKKTTGLTPQEYRTKHL